MKFVDNIVSTVLEAGKKIFKKDGQGQANSQSLDGNSSSSSFGTTGTTTNSGIMQPPEIAPMPTEAVAPPVASDNANGFSQPQPQPQIQQQSQMSPMPSAQFQPVQQPAYQETQFVNQSAGMMAGQPLGNQGIVMTEKPKFYQPDQAADVNANVAQNNTMMASPSSMVQYSQQFGQPNNGFPTLQQLQQPSSQSQFTSETQQIFQQSAPAPTNQGTSQFFAQGPSAVDSVQSSSGNQPSFFGDQNGSAMSSNLNGNGFFGGTAGGGDVLGNQNGQGAGNSSMGSFGMNGQNPSMQEGTSGPMQGNMASSNANDIAGAYQSMMQANPSLNSNSNMNNVATQGFENNPFSQQNSNLTNNPSGMFVNPSQDNFNGHQNF